MDNKLSELCKPEQFDAVVEIHGGEPFAVWAPAVNGSHVKAELYFALLAELEAKDKRIADLENNPTIKHMRAVEEALVYATDRASELEAKLATPIQVPSPAMFDEDDSAETVISVTRARLRAQGFRVDTDGATVEVDA